MAENRRGKEQRFYFSRGQLVLLGGAFALASVIIFFLGVFVGKGIEERRIVKNEEPSIKLPVKPSSQGSGGASGAQAKEELTFYDTLPKSAAAKSLVDDKPEKTDKETGRQGDKETTRAGDRETGRTGEAEKAVKLAGKDVRSPAKEEAPAAKTVEKKLEKTALRLESPQKNSSTEAVERQENGKNWTVQVNALPDENSAKAWVDKLKNKGYNAYVTEVRNKGKIWYRVRVGKYGSREEADKVVDSLKSKENLTMVFATSR